MSLACTVRLTPARSSPIRQSVQDWITGLHTTLDDAQQLRQLLPLVAAHFDADDRLALHRHLWHLWARVDTTTREAAGQWLDGRLAPWCRRMAQDWDAPDTWQALAEWHLGRSGHCPPAPDYVLALLQAHGQTGPTAMPQAQWLAVRAQLDLDTRNLPPAEADRLVGQTVAAVEAGVAPWAQGMARLFELAVRAGNEALATATLGQCVQGGGSAALSPQWFRRWLEGEGVLALTEPLQSQWLQPARLPDPAWRARLLATLHRPSAKARVQALQAALGDVQADPLSESAASGWRMLGALDACHGLAERRELPDHAVRTLLDSGALAPAAAAALCRALALQSMDRGDAAGAFRALAEARAADSDAQSRHWLSALLKILAGEDTTGVEALCDRLGCGSDGAAGGAEVAQWQGLEASDAVPEPLRTLARAMLARALLDGALEGCATDRRRDLRRAEALWQQLASDPDHADEARRRLATEPLQHWLPWLVDGPGREHLWISPSQQQACGELLIVLSCLESRHGYAQVRGLQRALPGHHLLFVNNPEFNWYSGPVAEELAALVRARVLPHFAPERVTCYFGSMGGHGALKLAARFGFRAVVFNAQTDLGLWATFRPNERQRLWAVAAGAQFEAPSGADRPTASFYLAVGSDTADREALTCLIASLRHCTHGQWIVEKFADPHHAGLVRRIARRDIPDFIEQAAQRLAALQVLPEDPPGMVAVARHQQDSFWAQLDAAPALKVEIVWRSGRLFIAESTRCGTVPV
jgi:hypothetical protein